MNMLYKHPRSRYLHARGFTLTEVLVVIAIVGILAAIAIPNFQSMIQANRIQAATSEFQAGLALARAEAIKRGGDARVTIVANELVGGVANWDSGFTVFYDTTGTANNNVAPLADSTTMTILMVTRAVSSSMTVTPNAPTPHLIFNGLGRIINKDGGQLPVSFAFKKSATGSDSTVRCLVTNLTGRTRTQQYSETAFAALTPTNKCPTL